MPNSRYTQIAPATEREFTSFCATAPIAMTTAIVTVRSPATRPSAAVSASPCQKRLIAAAQPAAVAIAKGMVRSVIPQPAVQIATSRVALSTSTIRLVAHGASGRSAARKKTTKIASSTAQ